MKRVKCQWCGHLFNRKHNRQVYCKSCTKEARREASRRTSYRYYHRWKHFVNSEVHNNQLGTSSLGPHRIMSFQKEEEKIHEHIKRLKLHP